MKLKRLGLYRVTRVLSWVLPLLIVAFVSIAAWSYLARSRNDALAGGVVDRLPPGLEVSTSEAQYVVTEGAKNIFFIKGMKMLTFPDRTVMEDVEVLIYAQRPGDPDRRIRGGECSHERATNHIVCKRKVSVELDRGTMAHTEELLYDHAGGVISSPVHTTLNRAGEMTGTSGRMEYFTNVGLMRLTDKFDIRLTRGGGIRGGRGEFHSRENWTVVSEGLEITSGNGRMYGDAGRADLLPGTYRPSKVTVDGKANAEAPSFKVNSDWLQSDLSEAGDIEHVIARGNVQAERKVDPTAQSGDSLNGTLKGPEVEGWIENGVLRVVEARQHPVFESTSSGTLQASESIRIEPSGKTGALRTRGASTFKRDGLSIDGSNFEIAVKDDTHEQVFNTLARATLTAAGLTANANRTTAHFDTAAKTLTSMVQTGNVTFKEEKGGRTGSSGTLTVRDGGNRIDMEDGNPVLTDAQGTLYASKISLDRKAETFTGEGGRGTIRMVSRGSGKRSVDIVARRVEGRLGGESPRVEYIGGAEMYPGDDSKIEAAKLTLFPKDKRVEAEGKVRSVTASQEVTADQLVFTDSGQGPQVAYYKGNVSVSGDFARPKTDKQAADKKVHMSLRSNDLEVHSSDGNLGRIIATGGVQMFQGKQSGRGTFMEYDVTSGAVLLKGTSASPAELSDEDRSFRGCSVQIDADGTRKATNCENGRVTTSINQK